MDKFDRFKKIIDDSTFNKIKNLTVCIVGIGGVGGYTVESLVRSGIESIIIVDYDIVDITNINRQIIATTSTIGMNKIDVMENRIKDINPYCNIIKLALFIDQNNYNEIFKYKIDYLIDACDTVSTKKLLIKECLDRNIKFITCMGTGNKFNPELLTICDIKKTSYDPLAKVIREWVNKEKIDGKIYCVSSTEKPINIKDRTPGSNSFVPGTAGLLLTSYIINDAKRT